MKTSEMYQVQVSTPINPALQIGPAVSDKRVLEPMVEAINRSVATGKEKDWRDARIVTVHNLNH